MRLWIKLWLYRLTRTCVRCGTALEPPTSTYDVYRKLSWDSRWHIPSCRDCMKQAIWHRAYGMGPKKIDDLIGRR